MHDQRRPNDAPADLCDHSTADDQEAVPYRTGMEDMDEAEKEVRRQLTDTLFNLDEAPEDHIPTDVKAQVIQDALGSDDPAACIRSIVESEDVSVARSEAAERLSQSLNLEYSDK